MKRLLMLGIVCAAISGFIALAGFTARPAEEKPLMEKDGLKLFEIKGSPEYADAMLRLASPGEGVSPGTDTFEFALANYQLGAQTPDADQKLCANSAKGQHIHFIWDNQPYVASYNTKIAQDVKEGHHVMLAFLSRSYHESLKHQTAFVLREFRTSATVRDDFNENAAHMFYSRPKGEYIGEKETKRLMLDFYLVNCKLSEDGYKVRATINGTEFMLTKWAPYAIEGLPLGAVKVKLELLDKDGKLVQSPYNPVERTCTLKVEPPVRK